jgi:hypothetical protein
VATAAADAAAWEAANRTEEGAGEEASGGSRTADPAHDPATPQAAPTGEEEVGGGKRQKVTQAARITLLEAQVERLESRTSSQAETIKEMCTALDAVRALLGAATESGNV